MNGTHTPGRRSLLSRPSRASGPNCRRLRGRRARARGITSLLVSSFFIVPFPRLPMTRSPPSRRGGAQVPLHQTVIGQGIEGRSRGPARGKRLASASAATATSPPAHAGTSGTASRPTSSAAGRGDRPVLGGGAGRGIACRCGIRPVLPPSARRGESDTGRGGARRCGRISRPRPAQGRRAGRDQTSRPAAGRR